MNETRSTRRQRLACEPCRRKKTRCPGEKPHCSFCLRLGQECIYYAPASGRHVVTEPARRDSDLESRINGIEDKLDRLIDHISTAGVPAMREGRSSRPPSASGSATLIASNIALEGHNSPIVLTNLSRELRECGEMYLTWCHKQPMELFDEETFMSSLSHRDQELILALQALSSRFPPGSLTKTKQDHLESLAKDSRRMIMDKVVKSEATLSSIQTLCILSCYNFTAGHIEKARLDLTVASHLKVTYYAETNEIHDRETRLCLRSIQSLYKIYGCPEQATRLMSVLRDRTEGSVLPDILGSHLDLDTETDLYGELGGFASRLGDTWQMIRAYALSRVSPNSVPPWDSRSDYNIVMQSHLRIDCAVPIKYRFSAETDMNNQDPAALQRHRKHWSALLFLHIVYAIVPCVLNHPFLLSMRLRNFRNIIPQSFVQQSYDHITRHAGWITYYISAAERKNFEPTDPCLAHCVAIVATIYIQHSFVDTVHLRERAQAGLETCLRFLDRMGLIWPMVAKMAANVRRLQQSVVPSPSTLRSDQAFSIDAQLLWDLLIYDRAGSPDAGRSKDSTSGFGNAQDIRADATPQTSTEFNLVGSAGISGHRSAGAHIPVYAPGDDATFSGVDVASISNAPGLAGLGASGSMEDIYGRGINEVADHMDPLFLADDYGRAIDGWLSYF